MQKIKILFLLLGFLAFNNSILAQEVNHLEMTLSSPAFTEGVSNQAVNIQFPNIPLWGWLEVTITSGYSNQLATGKLTKRYKIGHNVGSAGYFNQATEIPEAFGEVATQWYIGDFNHDTNSIPIYHLVSTSNVLTIKIEGVMAYAVDINLLKKGIAISPLVTAVSPGTRHYMSIMQDRVGIGTNTPDTALAVNGTVHSKEVKVDINGWPDFVFKKEYNLPRLEELYMIDVNKKVNELQVNNKQLIEENKVLTKKVEDIENGK